MTEDWHQHDTVLTREFLNSETGQKLQASLQASLFDMLGTQKGTSFEQEALNHRSLKGANYILQILKLHGQDPEPNQDLARFFDVSVGDTTRS